tara:strand:- start:1561 stop:2823 length:1263 start_codon:yes stop_codon:yes gene_type:complete
MHNLKDIRNQKDLFLKKLKDRNFTLNIDDLLNLDIKNRQLIQEKESLEQEKKIISKKKDPKNFELSKKLSKKIQELEDKQKNILSNIHKILDAMPNIALEDVPIGKDESANKEIKTFSKPRKFDFKILSHYEIGKKLNMLDFDMASRTTGSRFVFLKKSLALMERALINYMLDMHTKKFEYIEVSPPILANYATMFGTGQLPKFTEDQFEIKLNEDNNKDRKFLIPTAEVVLTNMVRESVLKSESLPLRVTAHTPCFRKEAGSYGKDTKGMMRQHQFHKVELVSIVHPEKRLDELDRMVNCAEQILKDLDLPFRKVLLCSGDMGFSAEKTYDLEVWIPSEKKYREISSCSSCGQFQARRMNAKFKDKDNKNDFVATLNGSGLAVGRTMIAIIENFQEQDGSIRIPTSLRPYMHNLEKIKI